MRFPGQGRERRGPRLRPRGDLQQQRRGNALREAAQHAASPATRATRSRSSSRAAVGMRLIGAYDPATYTCTPGAGDDAGAGRRRVDGRTGSACDVAVRRLGLRAPVPSRLRQAEGGRQAVRDPGGASTRTTRSTTATCRSTSGRPTRTSEHRVLGLLRGRPACRQLRRRAASRRSGPLHRRGRQQLLGRRAVHDRGGRAADRRIGSRLRPVHLPVHGPGAPPSDAGAADAGDARRRRRRSQRRIGQGRDEAADLARCRRATGACSTLRGGELSFRMSARRGGDACRSAAGPADAARQAGARGKAQRLGRTTLAKVGAEQTSDGGAAAERGDAQAAARRAAAAGAADASGPPTRRATSRRRTKA